MTSSPKKLDLLAFAPHPDDAELGCAGTLAKLAHAGKQVGVVDLTRGEMGSRGTPELRAQEAADASKVLGLAVRENLGFRDALFVQDEAHQLAIIRMIRRYQPDVVLASAITDRHPDHGRGSKLVRDAAFYSGLRRMETEWDGVSQVPWRPKRLFFYIQDQHLQPDFVVDISDFFEQKVASIEAFKTQFYNPDVDGPQTYISTQDFWHFLEARARVMGHMIGTAFGEGFQAESPLAVGSPLDLIGEAKFS